MNSQFQILSESFSRVHFAEKFIHRDLFWRNNSYCFVHELTDFGIFLSVSRAIELASTIIRAHNYCHWRKEITSGHIVHEVLVLLLHRSLPFLQWESSSSPTSRDTLISLLQGGRVKQGQPHYAKTGGGLSPRESRIVSEYPFYENTRALCRAPTYTRLTAACRWPTFLPDADILRPKGYKVLRIANKTEDTAAAIARQSASWNIVVFAFAEIEICRCKYYWEIT